MLWRLTAFSQQVRLMRMDLQVATSSISSTSSLVPFKLGGCSLSPPLKTQWRQTSELFWPALALRASKQSPLTMAPNNRTLVVHAVTTTSETEAEADITVEPTELEELEPPSFDKEKKRTKGLKHLMEILNNNAVEAALKDKELPDIRPGDIIQLRVEVPENKRRVSLLRGIVIAKHNAGINSTFRIRRVFAGVGVEMVFPLYSPNIKEIKVVDSRKVRRAKLFYLRHKIARLSTV